jgi:predicted small lipoprotein YifL
MKTFLLTFLVSAGLLVGGVSSADARGPLELPKAERKADTAAKKMARQDARISEWEITRGFRFTQTKWVFAWWAQLGDGRICTAQLVARYRNSKTTNVITYFRNQECS